MENPKNICDEKIPMEGAIGILNKQESISTCEVNKVKKESIQGKCDRSHEG